MTAKRMSFRARLATFADRPNECWEWHGGVISTGYGATTDGNGKTRLCHRMAYEMLVGPIPDGLSLDHLCRNTRCFNPAHLEPVTHQENVRRGSVAFVIQTGRCSRQHEMTPANTVRRRSGRTECRTCVRSADNKRIGARVRRMGKWYKPGDPMPPDMRGKWDRKAKRH